VLEAVVRVFDRTGNRQNKSRARLKYVIRKLGLDGFRKEYEAELAKIDADGRGRIAIDVSNEVRPDAVLRLRAPVRQTAAEDGFERFDATNCIKQRQAGYYAVIARLDRGDITSAQLRGAARLARQFSDGTVRLSNEQNLAYRFVSEASLTALHAELVALGLGRAGARTIHDVTSCPGADTCNLAVTRSRELTTAVEHALSAATGESAEAVKAAEALDIKISGCPNSCG
jgi:sulfite reductase beta subunit-like hemoprotein